MLKVQSIPTNKLFLDAVSEFIYAGNVRKPRPAGAPPGYQRDVYLPARLTWLERHAERYNEQLDRPVEVSARSDGTYAILDGGARWWMAQKNGQETMCCRVHEGISHKMEARLFHQFDKEVYKLNGVDRFLAMLAAGGEMEREIVSAIQPFVIGKKTKGVLDCVSTLTTIYQVVGNTRLISRTAKAIANTPGWGGLKMGKEWTGVPIDGVLFAAVALVYEASPSGFDEMAVREAMKDCRYSNKRGMAAIRLLRHADPTLQTAQRSLVLAKKLASEANRLSKGRTKIDVSSIVESQIVEAQLNRSSLGNLRITLKRAA